MTRHKGGGKQLEAVQALEKESRSADEELEKVCGFIRYVRRRAEDEVVRDVLRGLELDISDHKHHNEAYQQ